MSFPTTCSILAGGLGTRIRPVVNDRPKGMAEIAGKPFLEYLVVRLQSSGVKRILFCLGYQAERIQSYFGNGNRWGMAIEYSVEKEPRGTGGALKFAQPRLKNEAFFVMNGDTLLPDLNLKSLSELHTQMKQKYSTYCGTLTLHRAEFLEAQNVGWDQSTLLISNFSGPGEKGAFINAGVYLFEPALLTAIPAHGKCSLEEDILKTLAPQNSLGGFIYQGFMGDMGTPRGFERMEKYLNESSKRIQR